MSHVKIEPLVLEMPDQRHSGRTSLAVAMVKGMTEAGFPALYVTQSVNLALHARRWHGLRGPCATSSARFLAGEHNLPTLIVLDNWAYMEDRELVKARAFELVQRRGCPGQVVVIP